MFMRFAACIALAVTLATGAPAGQSDKKLTNADVIALAGAGLGDEIVIAKIRAAPSTDFDTSVAGLKALQAGHVSSAVIQVMIDPKPVAASAPPSSPDDPNAAHSPGIYLYATSAAGHTLTELQRSTPKQTKGSGAFLSGMTYGITKAKMRVVLDGANASVKSSDPNPSFYLYAPESPETFGGSYIKPDDFSLVKLTQKNDKREIVEGSSSVWGSSFGTDEKAKRGFTVEQVKPGEFKLTLLQPLPPGEYAFSENLATFFDFRILPPE